MPSFHRALEKVATERMGGDPADEPAAADDSADDSTDEKRRPTRIGTGVAAAAT